jgi:hypothetical protein
VATAAPLCQDSYPDASHTPGKQLLFKIDGGPGRLDMPMLAESRSVEVFLFPVAQNTMQIKQEIDQNYCEFKNLLQKHLQQLMNKKS